LYTTYTNGATEQMTETKFTPGPWIVVPSVWPTPPSIETEEGASLVGWLSDGTGFRGASLATDAIWNAHLIAAAPEMYELLERACALLHGGPELPELESEIWELLKKARGES